MGFRPSGSDLGEVGRHVRGGIAERASDAAGEDVLENGVRPNVLAVAHRGVKNAAFPVSAHPSRGVGRAGVVVAFHRRGFLHEQDVKVGAEVLQRIPLLVEI